MTDAATTPSDVATPAVPATDSNLPAADAKVDGASPGTETPATPEKVEETPKAEPKSVLGDSGGEQSTPDDKSKDGQSDQPAAELKITLPDGFTADEAALKEYHSVAEEVGLDSESASKLAAWDIQRQQRLADSSLEAWKARDETWVKDITNDPDFGGEKLAESTSFAKQALLSFGGEEAFKLFDSMGVGNHPTLFRMFARIGRANADDNSGDGGGGSGSANPQLTAEQQLMRQYPSMYKDGVPLVQK